MLLDAHDNFFSSDEWKNYVTKGYTMSAKPPSRGLFSRKPTLQSIYYIWNGSGAEPPKGNYYCIKKTTLEYIQYQGEYVTTFEWILVGKEPGKKPFQRPLTPEEEKIYNIYKIRYNQEKAAFAAKEVAEAPARAAKLAEEAAQRKRNAEKEQEKKKKYIDESNVSAKSGGIAVNKFINVRNEHPTITVDDFLRVYSQGGNNAVDEFLSANSPIVGGKRTSHKSKKTRKSKKK